MNIYINQTKGHGYILCKTIDMVAKIKITRYFRVNCNATFIKKKKKMKPRQNNNNI